MRYLKNIYLLLFIIIIFSCNNSKKAVKNKQRIINKSSYKEIAFQKFGNDTIFSYSINKSYILCQKSISKNNLNPNILNEFFVYDLNKKEIIYKDKISGSEISWFSDFELYIVKQRGIIHTTDDVGITTYIYNLKSNKKYTLKSNIKQNNIIN